MRFSRHHSGQEKDLSDDTVKLMENAAAKRKNAPVSSLLEDIFPRESIPAFPKSSRDITPILSLEARIPLEFWGEGWFLKEIYDVSWRSITRLSQEVFPANIRKDHVGHPGYVFREIGEFAFDICPVSSQNYGSFPFIPPGRLEPTGHELDRKEFIITRAVSKLVRNNALLPVIPVFLGIYPPQKLKKL